jgi:hypothetical protein
METGDMTTWEVVADVLVSMVPPILVGIIFYVVMRSIFRADSTERKIYSKMEAEERAKRDKSSNA